MIYSQYSYDFLAYKQWQHHKAGPQTERRAVAAHEAGHVIAVLALGGEVIEASCNENGGGGTDSRGLNDDEYSIVLPAGAMGEYLVLGGTLIDFQTPYRTRVTADVREFQKLRPLPQWYTAAAQALKILQANRVDLELVATTLQRCGRLTGADLAGLRPRLPAGIINQQPARQPKSFKPKPAAIRPGGEVDYLPMGGGQYMAVYRTKMPDGTIRVSQAG